LPRLIHQAPPGVGIDGVGERIGDRVEVGGDVESVKDKVVDYFFV
jgi:hypothetical protein